MTEKPRRGLLLLFVRFFLVLLTAVGAVPLVTAAAQAPAGPTSLRVDPTPVAGPDELIRRSDLIVYGHLTETHSTFPTSQAVQGKKVYHYVQRIAVKTVYKGTAGGRVRLMTSGVEPLPDAEDPLNNTYTGPLTEDDYVFFLRRAGSDPDGPYTLTGIWQGLYPVYDGKLTALTGSGGFPLFNGMTLTALKGKIAGSTTR